MGKMMQDIRYAMRQLRKTPGFTMTAVLTLALGIGANAAIFTLINAVLLKNLPVADPRTLLRVGDGNQCCINGGTRDDGDYVIFSTDTYQQFKKNVPEFEELAAMQAGFNYMPVTTRRDGNGNIARSSVGEFVSGNYFRTFGLQPALGRMFADADDTKGAPIVAVMSYSTWKNNYNSDPSVVGGSFWVNTRPVTVVGVAPEGFYGDRLSSAPPEFFLPLIQMEPMQNAHFASDPETSWLYVVGRIKPGVDQAALQQKISGVLRQALASTWKVFGGGQNQALLAKSHVVLTPGGAGIQMMQQDVSSQLKLLQWIAGLVLLIACANVANLLLVRGMARKTEMSLRTALGAARTRLIYQLLTESTVLALISGVVALGVSYLGTRMLLTLAFPGKMDVPIHATPSMPVLGFAFGVSLMTGLLFGMAPAWMASRSQPADALRSGTRTTVGGASLLQRSLVVLQTAVSLILLVGAGVFVASLNKMQHVDLKLESKNRYIVHINPQAAGYLPSQMEAVNRVIEERFHSIPGVAKVGLATYTPMEDNNWGAGVQIMGKPDPHNFASVVKINAEYFDSVGTKVVAGRGIGMQDTFAAPTVAVVNQAFVKRFFKPGENPIGQRFGEPEPGKTGFYEIVGVVENTAYQTVYEKDNAMYFRAMTQRPNDPKSEPLEQDTGFYPNALVVETAGPIGEFESVARKTLMEINPNLSIVKFETFDAQIAGQFTQQRMVTRLMTLFGALALLLATLGLYGVTAYTVARRTSEIGIRMALGAERGSVVAMILRSALTQTAIGMAVGVPVAYYCIQFVKSELYEMTSVSPATLALAMGVLLMAALIAGLIPGRRAASIDPSTALRSE